MKTALIFFYFFTLQLQFVFSQPAKILHYTETTGYNHQTRGVSFNMFNQMGNQNGFIVDNDSTGAAFSSLASLQQYDVVVFANTTGSFLLDSVQQQNFMQYINGGGNFIGIHSATDTYRHSTANSVLTGYWDWYAELVGASVQYNPAHVLGTPFFNMYAQISHPLLQSIPDPWYKAEEYYYWDSGYFNTDNIVLLKVEETFDANGQVNVYDSSRATTWYRELPAGQRIFYTSLGHDTSNYTSDTSFYRLLENAVLWAGNSGTGINEVSENKISVYPNPFTTSFQISCEETSHSVDATLFDQCGRKVFERKIKCNSSIAYPKLEPGSYFLTIKDGTRVKNFRLIKFDS